MLFLVSSHPVSAATSLGWIQLDQRRCGFLCVAKVKLGSAQAVCCPENALSPSKPLPVTPESCISSGEVVAAQAPLRNT